MIRSWLIRNLFYDRLFSRIQFNSVLDVGCGNNKMVDYFRSKGKVVNGIDLHPTRGDILQGDIFYNPFQPGSFDLVFSAHLIEHLPNSRRFASELMRLSNHYVCLITPTYTERFWDEPDHIRPYNIESLKRLFRLNRFVYCREFNLPFFEPVVVVLFDKADSRTAWPLPER